jgi:hypothetical protein
MRLALLFAALALVSCRDISHFSSGADSYQGSIIKGDFVRAGLADDMQVCMTIDTDHLQDTPGKIWSSDKRFVAEPLRPIPQLWHDPLSTLSFGEGREKNLVYVATATGDGAGDVMVVVSLMTSGTIEARLMRGAPALDSGAVATNMFGVFTLNRQEGPCSF